MFGGQGKPSAYLLAASDALSDHVDVVSNKHLVQLPFGLPPGLGVILTVDRNDSELLRSIPRVSPGWPIDCLGNGLDGDGDRLLDHCDPYPNDGPLLADRNLMLTPDLGITLGSWNDERAQQGLPPFGLVVPPPPAVEAWCALPDASNERFLDVPDELGLGDDSLRSLFDLVAVRGQLATQYESTTGNSVDENDTWFAYDFDVQIEWFQILEEGESFLAPAYFSAYACPEDDGTSTS